MSNVPAPIDSPASRFRRRSSPVEPRGSCGEFSSFLPRGSRTTISELPLPVTAKPPSCTSRWWWRQRSTRLSRSVLPPSAQGMMWWPSQKRRLVQPGKRQPPSRSRSAMLRAGGIDLVLLPTYRARFPRLTSTRSDASHPRRLAVSDEIPGPASSSERPNASAERASASTWMINCVRSVPARVAGAWARKDSPSSESASAFVATLPRSGPPGASSSRGPAGPSSSSAVRSSSANL